MKDFHGLFSAFAQLHMHLGPNHFVIEFLKSTEFFADMVFSG